MKQFDSYHQWLGIPPAEQPPHLYRLLGIGLFESNPDVIEGAADRQMIHVQRHKLGPHAAQSQKLLNELTTAKLCLLREDRKALYDNQLRRKLAAVEQAAAAPADSPPAVAPAVDQTAAYADSIRPTDAVRTRGRNRRPPQRSVKTSTIAIGGGISAAILVVVTVLLMSGESHTAKVARQDSGSPNDGRGSADSNVGTPAVEPTDAPPEAGSASAPDDDEARATTEAASAVAGEPAATAVESPATEMLAPVPNAPVPDKSERPTTKVPTATVESPPAPAVSAPLPQPASVPASGLELARHRRPIRTLAISPDGRQIISSSGSTPGQFDAHHFWDLRQGADVTAKYGQINSSGNALIFSRDGRYWIEATQNGQVEAWGVQKLGGNLRLGGGPPLFCLAATSDGQWTAVGGRDGVLLLGRNAFGEQRMFRWASPGNAPVSAVALSAAGTRMWAGCGGLWNDSNQAEPGSDHSLHLFDGAAWKEVSLAGHQGCIWGMSAVPGASRVVTASEDRTLRVWDLKRLKSPRVLSGHEGPVYAVAISVDGKLIASGGADRTVRIWNADSGAELHRFVGHSGTIRAIALSPDGHFAFSGGNDLVIRGWDLQSVPGSAAPKVAVGNPGRRVATPADDAMATAAEAVREIFADEYKQAKKSADKATLAERLLAQSASEQSDTERYALLVEARRLAIAAGAPAIVVRVVEQTGVWFDLDASHESAVSLEQLLHGKENLSPAARKELAEVVTPLADTAVERNDFSLAQQLLALAVQALRKAGDPPLARQFAQRLAAVEEQHKVYTAYQQANEKLAAAGGDDAEAQLAVGNYLCFVKQDWEQGLTHLAAGSDARLREAAALELKRPDGAEDQVKLGDLWYSLFEESKGTVRMQYADRAEKWYQSALPAIQGLNRVRIAKRLEEVGEPQKKAGGEATAAARTPKANESPLAARLKTAVGDSRLARTEVQGNAVGVPFYDVPPAGWLLAGLNVTLRNNPPAAAGNAKPSGIASIQPVYWNGKGTTAGETYGKPAGAVTSVVAKKGFAVRDVSLAFNPTSALGIDLNFARIGPAGLDATDNYWGGLIGETGQSGAMPRETSPPIVGVCGTVGVGGVSGLGLIYVDGE